MSPESAPTHGRGKHGYFLNNFCRMAVGFGLPLIWIHFNSNPDPAFEFDADPDTTFRFHHDVDPDPHLAEGSDPGRI
jgi:hypothetical protein